VNQTFTSVRSVLEPVLDVVERPVDEPVAPAWCVERGWDTFLLALDERELELAEANGLAAVLVSRGDAPPTLRELVHDVENATRVPSLAAPALEVPPAAWRGVALRKRGQIAAFLPALEPLARGAVRVVDVGAGKGHLSRLAAELFGRDTVAWERDPAHTRAGELRASERAHELGELSLRFVVADVLLNEPVLHASDLAVGLHACGELGDRLVASAARAGCDLALVSCCLQKLRATTRLPLSRAAHHLELPRAALGLTNLTLGADGVEATLAENLRAREARVGLRLLLRERGLTLAAGEEMRGINRRTAQRGLFELANRACSVRSLAAPEEQEVARSARSAALAHARIRRLSLPRNLLARLVELAVVLDRAQLLEERGLAVRVARLCERDLTPRNLALFASADPGRLPNLESAQ
jgi:SAM-dependent methyltransferase